MDLSQPITSVISTTTGSGSLIKGTVKSNELEGKTIGLYFASSRSIACNDFTNRLKEVYEKLKKKDFEIIFLSDDENEEQFAASVEGIPWLALPYEERATEAALAVHFGVVWLPTMVILDTDGRTVLSRMGQSLILRYGHAAYPFTKERIYLLKEQQQAKASQLPQKFVSDAHPHELTLLDEDDGDDEEIDGRDSKKQQKWGFYVCSVCKGQGSGWVYTCTSPGCRFNLHPSCANPEFDIDVSDVDDEDDDEVELDEEEILARVAEMAEEYISELAENAAAQGQANVQKISNELVEGESKKVLLGGLFGALFAVAVAVVTACCGGKASDSPGK